MTDYEDNPVPGRRPDGFSLINEARVEDVSLNFFYKPHTITLLFASIIGVMYFTFIR